MFRSWLNLFANFAKLLEGFWQINEAGRSFCQFQETGKTLIVNFVKRAEICFQICEAAEASWQFHESGKILSISRSWQKMFAKFAKLTDVLSISRSR